MLESSHSLACFSEPQGSAEDDLEPLLLLPCTSTSGGAREETEVRLQTPTPTSDTLIQSRINQGGVVY